MGTENRPKVPRSRTGATLVQGQRSGARDTSAGAAGADGDVITASRDSGAEPRNDAVVALPRPKWLRRRRRWLIGLGTAVLVIGGLIAAVIFTPMFAVKNISVDGNKFASDKTVLQELEPLLEVPLPQISTGEVQSLLSDVPQVRHVSIEAHPPSELVVHIEERVPVAILRDGKNFTLIDKEGTPLATVPERDKAPYPLIDGDQEELGTNIFRATTAVLAALPEDILGRLEHASADSVDSVELVLHDGKRVVWGNAEKSELKAKVLAVLLEETRKSPPEEEQAEAEPIEVYDVSTPTRPVTR